MGEAINLAPVVEAIFPHQGLAVACSDYEMEETVHRGMVLKIFAFLGYFLNFLSHSYTPF